MKFFVGRNMWTDGLILNDHYAHRLPTSVCLSVGIRDKNKVVGCCYFSNCTPGHWKQEVVELSRLVKKDHVKINLTQLISFGLSHLKRLGFDLVISYADYSKNHHGGIYQAASWNFHGKRKENLNGFIIDGEFIHRRSAYLRYGTSSIKLLDKIPKAIPFYDDGKFLYWKALNKKGKKKAVLLKLECNPYPKPGKREIEIKQYQEHPKRKSTDKFKPLFKME